MTTSPSFVPSCLRVSDVLEQHFDTAFAAPEGIAKLRELILTLAMQGKLVEQNPNDPPASELLKEIEAEKNKASHEGTKTRRKDKLPPIKPEEVPYQLPQGWEWVRLEEVSTKIHYGYTASADHGTKNVRLLRITDIQDNKVDWETVPGCNARKEDVGQYLLADNDILIARTGGTVGKSFLVQGVNLDAVFASYLIRVVPAGRINVRFIKYFAEGPLYWKQLYAACSGTGQPNVNGTSLSQLLLALPPLPEQHRIVARIDQLMARCDALEKLRKQREEKRLAVHAAAIKQLLDPTLRAFAPSREENSSNLRAFVPSCETKEPFDFLAQHFGELYTVKENVAELRKAILQLAVMGRLVPQDPNDPPASKLLKEIEAEKQRLVKAGKIKQPKPLPPIKPEEVPYQLPQGWEWVRIGDISITSDSGWSPQCLPEQRSNGQWGVLKVSAVSWGKYNPDENKALPSDKAPRLDCEVKAGDFLLSRANTDELVARSVIVEETPEKLMMSDKIVRFTISDHNINKHFVNFANGTDFSRTYYIANASGTSSSMKNVSRQVMAELPIPLPPLPEQHRIVARIDQLMALCDTLDQQIGAVTHKQSELLNAVMGAA